MATKRAPRPTPSAAHDNVSRAASSSPESSRDQVDLDLVGVRRRAVDTVTGISPDDRPDHHANAAHRGGAVADVAGTTLNRPRRRALTRNGPAPIDNPLPARRAPKRRTASTAKRASTASRTAKAKTAKAKKRPAARTKHKPRSR